MLFGRGGERWLESVRQSARGSLVLSAVVSSVYAASPAVGEEDDGDENYFSHIFEVTVVRTRDVVPSMGSLFAWPPRVPHTRYSLLVQRAGAAPYVLVKRYNDFRTLHARAERDGVRLSLGPALELPNTGSFAAFSSDPRVVALRSVGLQRYLDLLACGGCQSAAAHLRLFLALDDAPRQAAGGGGKKKVRGGCGGCGLTSAAGMDCADFMPSFF